MPVQRSQGRYRPQTPRSGKVAAGLPADVPAASGSTDAAMAATLAGVKRSERGTVHDSEAARALGRLGGLSKAKRDKDTAALPALVRHLGLHGVVSDKGLAGYLAKAEEFADAECARLARLVGGGECGVGPRSIVQSAAIQLAASRCALERGDHLIASKLAESSSKSLMVARDELARSTVAPGMGERAESALEQAEQSSSRIADALQNLVNRINEEAPAASNNNDDAPASGE